MRFANCDLRLKFSDRRPSVAAAALPPRAGLRRIATRKSQIATAFTLVELIISIGLVLIVMLGVNFVFRMTGDTIGSGQALSDQVRNNRGAQAVMFGDFGNVAPDGPSLLIRSKAIFAFRTAQDEAADRDYDRSGTPAQRLLATRTTDRNLDGDELDPEDVTPLFAYGDRSHRADVVSFFAQGLFRRQTGGEPPNGLTGPLLADMTSNEAWVWYGHSRQYDGRNDPLQNGSYWIPGEGIATDNSNNFYASQWNLARVAILLRQPDATGNIYDRSSPQRPQMYYEAPGIPASGIFPLSPLAFGSQPLGTDPARIERMRYDLAGTSIAGYRTRLATWIARSAANADWWSILFLDDAYRFFSNPYVVKPITPASYARQSSVFLQGASQFIVEYAGDFVSQNQTIGTAYGDVTDTFLSQGGQDGEVDFVRQWNDVNNNGVLDANEVGSLRKAIRWYGFPRDTTGDGRIRAVDGDVVPLRDLILSSPVLPTPLPTRWFEKEWPTNAAQDPRTADYANPSLSLTSDPAYTCAWGPNDTVRPKLIRVTIVLDDTSGRLPEGQTLEYVFQLP